MASPPPTYKYHSLTPGSDEIRVLTIFPGDPADAIELGLHHVRLPEDGPPPYYEALSYVWGSAADPLPVTVKETRLLDGRALPGGDQPGRLLVTQNLEVALRHLRRPRRDGEEPRTVWIDAVCINQGDNPEKGHQVQRMGHIYRRAARVVIWLGPAADNSDAALAFAADWGPHVRHREANYSYTLTPPKTRALLEEELSGNGQATAKALARLFARPWFERLWVVQEALLPGPRAAAQCGGAEVAWPDLLTCLAPVAGCWPGSAADKQRMVEIRYAYAAAGAASEDGEGRGADRGGWGRKDTLEDVLDQTKRMNCFDPRDRVYALLSLVPPELRIPVNYEISPRQVYERAFRRYADHTQRLDLLLSCEMREEGEGGEEGEEAQHDGPTWVPDWSRRRTCSTIWESPFASDRADFAFLGAKGEPNGILRAAGALCAAPLEYCTTPFALPDRDDPRTIEDPLLDAWELLNVGLTQSETEPYDDDGDCSFLEAFTCTLACQPFADLTPRRPHRPNAPAEAAAAMMAYLRAPEGAGIPGWRTTYYWQLVGRYAPGRRFVLTEDGYFGMAPAAARPGDLVAGLLGCRSPVVLRPTRGPDGKEWYQVVGECYLHLADPATAFYGPYPAGYRVVYEHDPKAPGGDGTLQIKHRDETTGDTSFVDPRLRDLGLYTDAQEPDTHPVITAAALREAGVELEYFDLV